MAENKELYYSLNNYLKTKFGQKVIKLSLDGGFTCPNRDGKISSTGCIFCSEKGSGDFAAKRTQSIAEQIKSQKELLSKKWPKALYIAYFQAFTNTYAPVEILEKRYREAIAQQDVVGLDIATRPDCIDEKVINLLKEISKEKRKIDQNNFVKKKREIKKVEDNYEFVETQHIQAVMELSKCKRLSDENYRKWNKSAYNYNPSKHRYEFKEELGRSYDVPKYIKER